MKEKLITLFLLFSTSLHANMRAPIRILQSPFYAMNGVAELVVNKETLVFECVEVIEQFLRYKCNITAEYEVSSQNLGNYKFEFLAPSQQEIKILVNDTLQNYILNKLDLKYECKFCSVGFKELYSIKFSSQLKKSTNTIVIKYIQSLSLEEYDYGYFKSSKWKHFFYYELWPLKEWTLSDTFFLSVQLIIPKNPSLWERIWKTTKINCEGYELEIFQDIKTKDFSYLTKLKVNKFINLFNFNIIHLEKSLIYQLDFDKNFPDRLRCNFYED